MMQNDLKLKDIISQKLLLTTITSSSTGNQLLWPTHWFWYKTIWRNRKLTTGPTGQGEDYTTGCLVDYDYIINYYRLITLDFSR